MQKICTFFILIAALLPFCGEASLTFDDAVVRTLAYSPRLRITENEIGEKEGLKVQSGLLPNPVAGYSVENVLGNKDWQGWESAETRYEVAQLIEIGGQRGYRQLTADYLVHAAHASYEAAKIDVLNRLYKLFFYVAGSQELLKIAKEKLRIAEDVHSTVQEKVNNGKSSILQQHKARIAVAAAQIQLNKAEIALENARTLLATTWGASCADFSEVSVDFFQIDPPQPFEECFSTIQNNPEVIKSLLEYYSAHQYLNLQQAEAYPDLILTVGYKTLQNTHEKGMIFGATIPIPIFDVNQGNIKNAKFQKQKMWDQHGALLVALKNKLATAHNKFVRAYNEVEILQSTTLKLGVESFKLAQEGYQEGKFEYLELLDSQTTLSDISERHIEAVINYHQSKADLLYLNTGD